MSQGKHDAAITADYESRLKNKKKDIVGIVVSYSILSLLAGLFVIGLAYKISGDSLVFGEKTHLVIETGSMSKYYNDDLASTYQANNYKTLHFDAGDICTFKRLSDTDELVEGEVYGYKYKGIIITHRLVKVYDNWYEFRGDANAASDPFRIKRSAIIYHYTGDKVPGVGAFVLFAQSYFGLWSIIGIIGIAVSSEVILYQINKVNKIRYTYLLGVKHDEK